MTPAALVVLIIGTASVVSAQAGAPRPAPLAAPSLPFPPAGEPSPDTGRMRPAHAEWARYDTPAMCLAASRNVQHLTDHRANPFGNEERLGGTLLDTLSYAPALDTLSTATRAAARTCLARVAADRVPARELTPLLQAALRAGDDALAARALDRQLALATPAGPRAQAEVLRAAILALLDAHPPRLETVATLVARLDALGAVAHRPRLSVHLTLFNYYAREAVDVAAAKRELEAVRALWRALTPDDLAEGIAAGGVTVDFPLVLELLTLDDPRAIAPYAAAQLPELERKKIKPEMLAYLRRYGEAYVQALVTPLGKPVPAVRVNYLFAPGAAAAPAGARAPEPTEVQVRPGRVTFWLVAPEDWRENLPAVRQFAAGVRQLRARYGDSIDIVVFTKTVGYTPGSLVQQPAEEAAAIRKYFFELRRLPATLAVSVSPITTLPDGNRQVGAVPYDTVFGGGGFPVRFIVAERDGTFARLFTELRPSTALFHVLDQVVHGSAAGARAR